MEPFNLKDEPSTCTSVDSCPRRCISLFFTAKNRSSIALSPHFDNKLSNFEHFSTPKATMAKTEIILGNKRLLNESLFLASDRQFYILVLVSLHNFQKSSLTCGPDFMLLAGFQNLLAFLYALNQVNEDPFVLPRSKIGALILDDCSSDEKSVSDIFDCLNGKNGGDDGRRKIGPDDIVAVLDVGNRESDTNLHNLLHSLEIPHISLHQKSTNSPPKLLGEFIRVFTNFYNFKYVFQRFN